MYVTARLCHDLPRFENYFKIQSNELFLQRNSSAIITPSLPQVETNSLPHVDYRRECVEIMQISFQFHLAVPRKIRLIPLRAYVSHSAWHAGNFISRGALIFVISCIKFICRVFTRLEQLLIIRCELIANTLSLSNVNVNRNGPSVVHKAQFDEILVIIVFSMIDSIDMKYKS